MLITQTKRFYVRKEDRNLSNEKGRGKSPSKETIIKLWTVSGGRCQFDGCNEKVFRDDLTGEEFNTANMSHIIASSKNGPRGNEQSNELSDKLENLMLLCPKHHKEIDTFPERYPAKCLKEMKMRQEQMVQELLDSMYYPKTEIIILESPIKGKSVHVDSRQTVDAVRSLCKNPASQYPVLLRPIGSGVCSSPEYWKQLENALKVDVESRVCSLLNYSPDVMLSVFPLAPIPLIAKLGELLGDKRSIDIFQKTREPDTWEWLHDSEQNSFEIKKYERTTGDPGKVAVIISLSAEISEQRVTSVFDAGIIYRINASNIGVDCISSREDLRQFWQMFQSVCDRIKNEDHMAAASVFPAVPVSAAYEIGRRHMRGVHPILTLYDDYEGFFETLEIGG